MNSDLLHKITARVLKQDQDKTSLISKEGPAINGSEQKTDLRNINVFNLLDSFTSVCQTSGLLDDKEPEIPALERILQSYNLSNTMVSADALHCQIKTLESIHQRKGMYTLTVNENQLPKQEHIKEVMRLNEKKCQSFNFNQGHYEIFLIDHKLTVDDFPHAKAYVRMLSYKRTGKPDCSPVEQYFVSSAINPELIMAAIDSREEIVGGFDCLTDDFLKEESCTFMDKHAIKVMAVFNNIAYGLYRLASAIFNDGSMAETRIRWQNCPEKMLSKLAPKLEKQNLTILLKQNMRGMHRGGGKA